MEKSWHDRGTTYPDSIRPLGYSKEILPKVIFGTPRAHCLYEVYYGMKEYWDLGKSLGLRVNPGHCTLKVAKL